LGRRSVIPYVHGDDCCIAVWCCSSLELNLVAPVVCSDFYIPSPDSYTVIQGLTDGLRVVKSLYNS
jgi:hypothetical protein